MSSIALKRTSHLQCKYPFFSILIIQREEYLHFLTSENGTSFSKNGRKMRDENKLLTTGYLLLFTTVLYHCNTAITHILPVYSFVLFTNYSLKLYFLVQKVFCKIATRYFVVKILENYLCRSVTFSKVAN